MDWVEPASQNADEGVSKRRAVGSTSSESKAVELNHCILSIQNAQQIRQLMAAVLMTYFVPYVLLEDAASTNKEYSAKAKGQAGHKMGPPHVHSWRSFIRTLIFLASKIGEDKLKDQDKKAVMVLQEHLKTYESAGTQAGHYFIQMFRFKQTRDKEHAIVNLTLSQLMEPTARFQVQNAIHQTILALGGEVRAGAPPALAAERKMQETIDKLKDQLK